MLDAHEYAPEEFSDRLHWRFLYQAYKTWLCRTGLSRVHGFTTVCDGIADEYARAMGNIHTLFSPYFDDAYYPEALVLKAVVFFSACQVDNASAMVSQFHERYDPVAQEPWCPRPPPSRTRTPGSCRRRRRGRTRVLGRRCRRGVGTVG